MTELAAINVGVEIAGARLIADVSFVAGPGELVVLLGPNGAGKSTLARACVGAGPVTSGRVELDGQDIGALPPARRALSLAYLPQAPRLAWPMTVRDVVALGRFAHGARLGRLAAPDALAVEEALGACDLSHLAGRAADTLSGGEGARMHLARAMAAQARFLVADEPVAALDPRHQIEVMNLIAAYVAQGAGALLVLHDIALAARYASRLLWMTDGRVCADGPPAETLTPERLGQVFGVQAEVTRVQGRFHVQIDGPA